MSRKEILSPRFFGRGERRERRKRRKEGELEF